MLEVMDEAPDWLTWRERYVLMAMADNFNDDTRQGWPAFEGEGERSDKFRRRARCTRRQFYETLGELINKGVLVVVVAGHNGRQAVYRIPRLATAKPLPPEKRRVRKPRKPKAPDAVGDTHPEPFPEDSANAHGTLTEPALGAETPHATEGVGCGNDGSSVRRNRTPIPQVSSTLKELKTSSSETTPPIGAPTADPALADEPERASDPGGLPAGHGAKAAPREREMHQGAIDELDALSLPSDLGTENRQREREAIHSAIAALERVHGFERAHKVVEMTLEAVEWAAGDAREVARAEALEAIRAPRWHNADTTRRYEFQVDAHTLEVALGSRPLASWPSAVTELLGLGAAAA